MNEFIKDETSTNSVNTKLNQICPFVAKTYSILENPSYQAIVSWADQGNQFTIHDEQKF